jgi:hypothetical protein
VEEVLLMEVQLVNGETDDSHPVMLPVWPLRVSVPLVEPEQIVVPPVTDPPTVAGSTVTVVAVDVSGTQVPLCTMARKRVVCVRVPLVYVVVVLLMDVQLVNGDTADCHPVMVPVWPLRVSVPLVEPEQMVVPPVTDPPTEEDPTVTVVVAEFADAQLPLFTTARNCVVCDNAPLVYVVAVLLIAVQDVNGDIEDSQPVIVPVCPLSVSVPLVFPGQTVEPPVTDPPTVAGLTVTVVAAEFAGVQAPLCTTARYCMVCESVPGL